MADISLVVDECMDDPDEGVFEQGDTSSAGTVDLETLPPLVRVQNYAKSTNIYDRQMVLRVVLELFRTGPTLDGLLEDLPEIMGVIATIAEEDEVVAVRTDLLEQIPALAARVADCSSKYPQLTTVLTQHLVPIIVRNLSKSDSQIRNAAQSALFSLLEQGLLSREEAELTVCPTVLAMSRVESMTTDLNTSAITLMSRLAPLLGAQITERVFLHRFSELCSNQVFYVKKVCATHFGDFCAVIRRTAFEQILLPSYVELCGDEIWGVRKECAEVIMSVSCACSPNIRRTTLAPVFLKLLQDETRWVRMAAFHSLGPFISTFADPTVTSITYNNIGELVLVNADGNEFKLTSPTAADGIPRPTGDFHMLYHSSDKLGSSGLRSFIDRFTYDDEDDKEVDIEVNPLCNILDEEPESKDVVVDIEMPSLEEPSTTEMNKEDTFIQKNFGIVSKAMFGEIVTPTEDCDKENIQFNGHVEEVEPEENLKEIVETVKNAVLSYRNKQEDLTAQCNVNVIDTRKENCDNLNSRLGDHNYYKEKGSGDKIVENGVDNENLDLFNSYNYWRINPELPLDPSVVDAGRSPKKNIKMLEEHNLARHLDEFYAKLSLDDTLEECCSNKTFTIESSANQQNNTAQESEHVPQFLIDHYVSMTDPNLAQTTDTDMAYHCAYSLPAVALTLGSQNWHLLKNTAESLAADMQYKVRRTVACSLHELALILGPEIAASSLTPLFDGFIKDLDEVRIGVLNNLAHFLKLITPVQRSVYLPRLADFLRTDSEWNWRFRQELARQLLMAVSLFRPSDAAKHLAGIAHELMCDKVAAVRQVALSLTTQIVKHISPERRLTSHLLVKLAEGFAHSKKWKRRQTFALLSSELLIAQAVTYEQFGSDVMPHLLDLSWDPVPNVRLVVARTIAKHIIVIDYFRDPNNQFLDSLETVLRRLQTDKDRDVRQNAVLDQYTNPLLKDRDIRPNTVLDKYGHPMI